MFAVCPRGGCTCMLTTEQQQQHFNFLYNGVCTIVRKCEPSRKSIFHPILSSCDLFLTPWMQLNMLWSVFPPDLTQWKSLLLSCFEPHLANLSTTWPWGVGGGSRLDCVDEQVFCVSLARRACDWEMMQLFVGEPGSDLSVFQIVGEQPFSKDDLEEWARRAKQAKQEQMVLRAARPAQKITSTSKQTERLRGHRPCGCFVQSVRSIRRILRVQWRGFEQKEEAAASSSHAVPAKSPQGRSSYPWGPAGQTGWGAICNMHLNKHDSGHTGCPFPQHVRQLPSRVRSPTEAMATGRVGRWSLAEAPHAIPPCSNRRQRHGGFRRRLTRGRSGHTAWSVVKEGIKRACP